MPKPTSTHFSTKRPKIVSLPPADHPWMDRALQLARDSVGLAHPNPLVGAVLVKNGRLIGQGFHMYDGLDHAEIVALREAGASARGATLYVTLEPCSHTGRTPPCAKAIIEAGVARVVAAMPDPNPKVTGRGFASLEKAGVRVSVGEGEEEAMSLNEDFARWITSGLPFVTLKSALTLDGQIAARAGSPSSITGEAALAEVQRLRHAADALLTGIGTVLADDPRLTDRTGLPRRRNLLRVVVDSRLRLPLQSKLVQSARGDVIVFTVAPQASPKAGKLRDAGIEVVHIRAKKGRLDLAAVLRDLGRRQILNVLLEAGAELNGAALQAGLVDKLFLFYTPRIMGTGGVPVARIPSGLFAPAPRLSHLTLHGFGSDFAVEGYFHDVYGDHRARRKN